MHFFFEMKAVAFKFCLVNSVSGGFGAFFFLEPVRHRFSEEVAEVPMSDTSNFGCVFQFLGSSEQYVFLLRGGGGFSPQISARLMLHPEDRRSSAGDAFLCAAAA